MLMEGPAPSGLPSGDWLQEAVQEKVTEGQAKYLSAEVIDSR